MNTGVDRSMELFKTKMTAAFPDLVILIGRSKYEDLIIMRHNYVGFSYSTKVPDIVHKTTNVI